MAPSCNWSLLWAQAAATLFLLASRGAGAELREVVYPRRLPDLGPCVPPGDPSARTGLRVYRRFHANHSLIGRPVPCTRDDKFCFNHNLLFDPQLDSCEPLGGGKDPFCDLRINKTEFEHGSGRVVGACQQNVDPCPGIRMAFDGRCYSKEVVRDVICGCEAQPMRHILAGAECRRAPHAPLNVSQPPEDGRCLIPDLRFPDIERKMYAVDNVRYEEFLRCNRQQELCFSRGKVSVRGYRGCYALWSRGPCPVDHVVALDKTAAAKGRARGGCVHERGRCPRGHRRMAFDGRCHEDRELQIAAPGTIIPNIFGDNVILERGVYAAIAHFVPVVHMAGLCKINRFMGERGRSYHDEGHRFPVCSADDRGLCHLYEVEAEPPNPLDD